MSVAKRFDKYEILGELFCASQKETLELTITVRMFLIIREVVIQLSEILEIDSETLIEKLLSEIPGIVIFNGFGPNTSYVRFDYLEVDDGVFFEFFK